MKCNHCNGTIVYSIKWHNKNTSERWLEGWCKACAKKYGPGTHTELVK